MKQLTKLKESFKLNMNYLYIALYDLIFHVIVLPTLMLARYISTAYSSKLNLPSMEQIALSPELAETVALQAKGMIIFSLVLILAVIIIILAAWSFSRGLIYTTLLKKNLTKKYFLKFAALNLLIGIVLIAFSLLFIPLFTASTTLAIIYFVLLLIAVYFITLIYITFTKKQKVFESIGESLALGIKKLPKTILPIIFIIIMFIFAAIISAVIGIQIIDLLILILFLAWARIYFIKIIED